MQGPVLGKFWVLGMSAEISECGLYRYKLVRQIPQPIRWVRPCLFIMLNPSTADAELDDPTIRRCISFAKREGCTRLTVVNLFALRATDPKALRKAEDPEGPLNDGYLLEEIETHQNIGLTVAAWGADPFARRKAEWLRNQIRPIQCLGFTRSGAPRHPLYLKADAPLTQWPRSRT